jgi:hypothetical protein
MVNMFRHFFQLFFSRHNFSILDRGTI